MQYQIRYFIIFLNLILFNFSISLAKAEAKSLDGLWILESINGEPIQKSNFSKGAPQIKFNLKQQKVTGHSGCNRFMTSYLIKGHQMTFKPMAMTRMACPGEGEKRFLTAFQQVNRFQVDGMKLILLKEDQELLIFKLSDEELIK